MNSKWVKARQAVLPELLSVIRHCVGVARRAYLKGYFEVLTERVDAKRLVAATLHYSNG
ncbi:MAG: hypothetical protein ACYTXY_37120 [Nostoc sp.]